ncbi:hypothetical protein BG910_08145 [Neisseria chenwenguii]|uniref:Lipopolysaccharide assembly protein A domain-containing protein n=1 Tax=Neisseria chenwenguii TaxID=1853278 RepID=A0A220S2P6_9NEIS|nr:LapA family protein [Neisseria chenwenguii]ASK27712.1 hypothetical protein BG910_08145 [Neisseria chenwenguii]
MKIISLVIKIVILLVFLLLAIANIHMVDFNYLPGQKVNTPLIIVLFGAFVIGVAFGMFALFVRLLGLRAENNRLRAEVKKNARFTQAAQMVAQNSPVPSENTKPKV